MDTTNRLVVQTSGTADRQSSDAASRRQQTDVSVDVTATLRTATAAARQNRTAVLAAWCSG